MWLADRRPGLDPLFEEGTSPEEVSLIPAFGKKIPALLAGLSRYILYKYQAKLINDVYIGFTIPTT